MDRRTYLGAVAVTALSGCMGYEVQRASVINSRTEKIADLESEIEQRQSTVNQQTVELERLRQSHVVKLYELAVNASQFANGDLSSGLQTMEANDYPTATAYFRGAYSDYAQSERLFEESQLTASEYELDVDEVINDSMLHVRHMKEAAFDLSNAMDFYADDRLETGDEYLSRARSHEDTALVYDVEPVDEFRNRLAADDSGQSL